jgi:hypothetical protein
MYLSQRLLVETENPTVSLAVFAKVFALLTFTHRSASSI